MESATTVILFIVALIVSVGFLLLVLTLVPAINQLRLLLAELEKTAVEIKELASVAKHIGENVENKLDSIDEIISSARKLSKSAGSIFQILNKNLLKRAGWLAVIPAIKFGWSFIARIKGGKK
jgi:predicted PurR-regulated permease PerM